jgi:hypothetical protein
MAGKRDKVSCGAAGKRRQQQQKKKQRRLSQRSEDGGGGGGGGEEEEEEEEEELEQMHLFCSAFGYGNETCLANDPSLNPLDKDVQVSTGQAWCGVGPPWWGGESCGLLDSLDHQGDNTESVA